MCFYVLLLEIKLNLALETMKQNRVFRSKWRFFLFGSSFETCARSRFANSKDHHLDVKQGREGQLWTEDLVRHKVPPPRVVLHVQPLLQRLIATRFHDPQPAVIALDERPAGLRPPDPPGEGIQHAEPRKHGPFEVVNAQPVDDLTLPEVVHCSQVVELRDEVHVGQLVHDGLAGDVARHDGGEQVTVDSGLFLLDAHGLARS